jgi:hypothetical protein
MSSVLYASAEHSKDFLRQRWPDHKFSKYSCQALVPELNRWGKEGWELIHIEPVQVGKNGDIMVEATGASPQEFWSAAYFCVFKRSVQDSSSS